MHASSKVRIIRDLLGAIPWDNYGYNGSDLTCDEMEKLAEAAFHAIRRVAAMDDPKPPPASASEFITAMRSRKIQAIKDLRGRGAVAGVEGLREAKEAVEGIMEIFSNAVAIEAQEPMPF